MKRTVFVALSLTMLAVVVLGACGPKPTPTPPPQPTALPAASKAPAPTNTPVPPPPTVKAGPKPGGKIVVGHRQEPDRFWQPFTGLTVAYEVGNLMNPPLLQINDKLQFIPVLITEVPTTENGGISKDGLTITLHLRKDVKWHDGQPFTSKDVRFTWQVIMMSGTDVRGRVGWDKISAVETPDPYTAVLKFSAIDAAFLSRLSLVGMLPEHLLGGKTAEQLNKDPWFRAPIGTGPFKFKEWVPGDHITMVKNPDYFEKGKPYVDTIIWKVIPDANALLNQLQTGEVDIALRLNNPDAATIDTFANVKRVSSSSVTPWLIWMNNTIPGLKDLAVRQGMAYALDREGICKNLLKGLVEPAYGLVPPSSWAYNPNIEKYPYNPDKANQVLDAAGWKKGADGVREKDGVRLSFKLINIAGEQERIQVLSTAIAQWKKVGIDVQIELVDVAAMWGAMLPKRTYQLGYSYTGRTADPDIGDMYFCPENNPSTNFAGYCNPEVDRLLKEELSTFDQAKRKEALFKVQEIVAKDIPYLYLAWRADHTGVNKRVQGYLPCPGYYEMWNAQDWWVE